MPCMSGRARRSPSTSPTPSLWTRTPTQGGSTMGTQIGTAPPASPPARSWTDASAVLLGLALCAAVLGCASGTKHSTIPSDGPTMAEIYRQHMAGVGPREAPAEPQL